MSGERPPYRLNVALHELAEGAETLQRAAASLDDAVGRMHLGASPAMLREAISQIQTGSVALGLSLLGLVASAERVLGLISASSHGTDAVDAALLARAQVQEVKMSHHEKTMREVVQRLREGRAEAMHELQECDHALGELLRHLETLAGALEQLNTDIVTLAAREEDQNRLETLFGLGERSGRASSMAEQIAGAFKQLREAVKQWRVVEPEGA
jgi:DNA repair exonuclease SbcCD ATPase subunit